MSYTVEEVLEFVEENDVKFIRLAFCDLMGRMKNISIVPEELPYAFEYGYSFDGFSIRGFSDIVHSDLLLKPDADTLSVLPWRPQQGRVVRFYCDVANADGTPFVSDGRNILKNSLAHAKDMGYTVEIGEECEFYLFKQDEEGTPTDIPLDDGCYFDVAPADKGENIRREIILTLEEMGIKPESSHHEQGPGQNEIVFRSDEALKSADNLLTFKNVVRAVAMRNGLDASFLPKPIHNKSGNGLHVNISLSTLEGDNIFREEVPEQTLISEHFMAGIMNRIKEITLFLNTRNDSYKRLGEFEAPQYITWSRENRAQLIRIPTAIGNRKRCELRSPDPCINPYLAYSLIIEAGLSGILNNEALPKPVNIDLCNVKAEDVKELETLPKTLEEAIGYAKESSFVKSIIGEETLENFIRETEKEFLS
ncbi:MAG: glutamine synthetase family protein [Eubacterium sp.]|nr:glutamine synthetase family protein [Eubacterium sp.]